MIEIREILRLQGRGLHEVARLSGTDRRTVRRYRQGPRVRPRPTGAAAS